MRAALITASTSILPSLLSLWINLQGTVLLLKYGVRTACNMQVKVLENVKMSENKSQRGM